MKYILFTLALARAAADTTPVKATSQPIREEKLLREKAALT